jgi:hypothetical protein
MEYCVPSTANALTMLHAYFSRITPLHVYLSLIVHVENGLPSWEPQDCDSPEYKDLVNLTLVATGELAGGTFPAPKYTASPPLMSMPEVSPFGYYSSFDQNSLSDRCWIAL